MKIGVDMVSIERLAGIVERLTSFQLRVFTPAELGQSGQMAPGRRNQFLAGRFAVKEAVVKVLGTGLAGGFPLTDIETLRQESGAPLLVLHGKAKELANELGLREYQVTISHEGDLAMAYVVML